MLRLAAHAMGTRFELVLEGVGEAQLRAAGEEALAEITDAHRRLSAFAPDSVLSHVNRTAEHEPAHVDPDTFELLALCAEVHARSAGAFDPSVAPALAAAGLRGAPTEDLEAASARVGFEHVTLEAAQRSVRFERPGMQLDLGGVAKGHGLDLAAAVLREAGVPRALLHGGTSSVIAVGDGWSVALDAAPGAPVALLEDCSLSVSAPDGRVAERDGETHGHVLDPRTGASARGVARAACVTTSAALADAWTTALLLRGADLPDLEGASCALSLESPLGEQRWTLRCSEGAPRRIRIPAPQG